MFALLFKCLDLLLLMLHGEAENQGYNHSNEGSHTHLFIHSSICLTWLENFQVNQLTSILDLEAAAKHHGQVVASVTVIFACVLPTPPPPPKNTEKKTKWPKLAFKIKVFVEMKCWEDLSNLHLCGKKGLRLQEVTNTLSHTASVWFCMKMVPWVTNLTYINKLCIHTSAHSKL